MAPTVKHLLTKLEYPQAKIFLRLLFDLLVNIHCCFGATVNAVAQLQLYYIYSYLYAFNWWHNLESYCKFMAHNGVLMNMNNKQLI